jgi:hypothetical protein
MLDQGAFRDQVVEGQEHIPDIEDDGLDLGHGNKAFRLKAEDY